MASNKSVKKVFLCGGITVGIIVALVVLIPILALIASLLSIPFSRAVFERSFKNVTNESDTIPVYAIYGELYIGDEKVDISTIYKKQRNAYGVDEIFCVNNGRAYFVNVGTHDWTIASIDLESKTIQDHCVFPGTKGIYSSKHYGEYNERTGYYYEGQIILSDFHSVFVYDIATEETSRYEYEQYDFPERKVYSEYVDGTLHLHIMDSVQTFTLEDMAANSEAIAKIYNLKDKTDWRKSSYLKGFLAHNTVEVVGERIYHIGSVSNWTGECYAIILEYDVNRGTWMYVTKCLAGGNTNRYCYVVPVVQT